MKSSLTFLQAFFFIFLTVNVAQHKPAYHSYSRKGDAFDASNAVDRGKSDLSEYGGQCAVSYAITSATWWVNLTTVHSIHHITIYFRTDNNPWGIVKITYIM